MMTIQPGAMAHGGTYSGNVVGAAAGIATLELLETEPIIETINKRGKALMTGVGEILTEAGIPHTVTGVPSMFGMVLGTDDEPHDFREYFAGDGELYDILENCMARDKALYDGHAVAAVAAIDAETARKALKLIKVDYKILPHVTDVDEAMKPGAPIIQPRVKTKGKSTNISLVSTYGHGDVDAGFEQADIVIEKSYKTEQVHQGYIEPHATLATMGPDGRGEIWVCTQGHYMVRDLSAAFVGMETSQLRVTASEIGGGFAARVAGQARQRCHQ